ncbi:MAG TPA: hypothetical protein DER10_03700 [Elusimicrobia bacterium]|nr:MAG: hypothetical protein A2X33_04125 [Elusimicrobia bacterium GWA2_51_34]HAF96504.1 hypothetical protein [Elusimicrobiota bacterium]HCE97583.1 hypothetical protein [Elusimicrobiota bacterium]
MTVNPTEVLDLVVKVLNTLDIPHMICGSLASSVHGLPRATMDADLVAEIKPKQAAALVQALEKECYIDEDSVMEAISNRSSFNIIHLASSFKVDVFILRDNPYSINEFSRRTPQTVAGVPETSFFVATPEDVILTKLRWYHQGGETSENQWSDVAGIIKVQGERLDRKYLKHWASELGLASLLEKAL